MPKRQAGCDAARAARDACPSPAMRMHPTMTDRNLDRIRRGSAAEAMDAAKAIIGAKRVDWLGLLSIVNDHGLAAPSRIAAAYALGFAPSGCGASEALMALLADSAEADEVRDYAAEALANIGEKRAIPLLRRLIEQGLSEAVMRSCVYALDEIGGGRESSPARGASP